MPDPSTYGTIGGGVMEGVAAAHERSREDKVRREGQSLETFKTLIQAGWKPADLDKGVKGGVVVRIGDAYLEPPRVDAEAIFKLKLQEQKDKKELDGLKIEVEKLRIAAGSSKAETDRYIAGIHKQLADGQIDAQEIAKQTARIRQETARLELDQKRLGGETKPTDTVFKDPRTGKLYMPRTDGTIAEYKGPEGVDLTGLQKMGGEKGPTMAEQVLPGKIQNVINRETFINGQGQPPRTVFDESVIQTIAIIAARGTPPMDVYHVIMEQSEEWFGHKRLELVIAIPGGTKLTGNQIITKYASVYGKSLKAATEAVRKADATNRLRRDLIEVAP